MKALTAETLALLTAVCWALGSFFEKKGLKLGGLSPQMGLTLRTATALLILTVVSWPMLKQIPQASTKSLLMIILGGGVLAGTVGLLCFYSALSKGDLWLVTTLAFAATPVLGCVIGSVVMKEHISGLKLAGIALCIVGVVLVMWKPGVK